jgi:hypothetical protein
MMRTAIQKLSMMTLALLPLLLTSCVESEKEMLIGRWFNRSNSIRFESTGALTWNATVGRAVGQFQYAENVKRTKQDVPVKNLTIRMIRGGVEFYGEYELSYIGRDRMRLTQVNRRSQGRASDIVPSVMVLKRAENETDGASKSAPVVPQATATS